ncbi:MAG TPA: ABC-F family ATP-binding cassette domain-containing protein [Bacillota bacterium]
MIILDVRDLGQHVGVHPVFRDVSFTVRAGERVGIVGANGSGKTTLLRILAGLDEASAGTVTLGRGVRLGYLAQDHGLAGQLPLFDAAMEAFADLNDLEDELRDLEARMEDAGGAVDPALLERYGTLLERFTARGGYEREARTRAALLGLGFRPEQLQQPVAALSGGQRARGALAQVLLRQPDLLLLDEPTNHLDLRGVEWLEQQLRGYRGTVLVVSHDRAFLNATATRILALEGGRLEDYHGNYDAYVVQREQRRQAERETYAAYLEERRRLTAFIEKWRAGTRAGQARDRAKKLQRLDAQAPPPPQGTAAPMRLRFDPAGRSFDEALVLDEVGHRYDGRWLFRNLSTVVHRGERIALVGPNGAGKTTLLRILAGRLDPAEGVVDRGPGVDLAWFAQDLGGLDDAATVLDNFMSVTGMDIPASRTFLASFGFRGDDVYKPAGALSGGERNRVLLARLVASRANTLVLDEPTNHLDLDAREALESALSRFAGTLIFASHDRYFVERLATRVWAVEEGGVTLLEGGYDAYRQWRREPADGDRPTSRAAPGHRKARERGAPTGPARALAALEAEIEELEAARRAVEKRLADPATCAVPDDARRLAEAYRRMGTDLEERYGRWARMVEELDAGQG